MFSFHKIPTKSYNKKCCVPSFIPNKPNLDYFMRESVKNALKPLKAQLRM